MLPYGVNRATRSLVTTVGIPFLQYGVLATISRNPDIDQQTLARWVALDTSTTSGVVDRLELKGFVTRNPSPNDRRVKLLTLTEEGKVHLETLTDGMLRSQERMLAPLSSAEREKFMRLVSKLVQANNEFSLAPSARGK